MTTTTHDPRALVAGAVADLGTAPAQDVVRWAVETFGSRLAVASSMQDGVLAHLVGQVAAGTDVLFLDTGYHFAETLGTRDVVAATYPVRVLTLHPVLTVAEQDARYGAALHTTDPDRCCAMRKTEPLDRALLDYDAWITGVRRSDTAARATTEVVSYDERRGTVRIAPLASWTDDDVAAYVAEHGIVVNPLLHNGYPSIGCGPCTRAVAPGEAPRAGRWAGLAKTECGIH